MRRSPIHAALVAATVAATVIAAACADNAVAPGATRVATGPSAAYDVWRPAANDLCSADVHNAWSTVGEDGKLYPTWHPPTDPVSGCSFGHEHGRDPHGSTLYSVVGDLPFGYVNEQLDVANLGLVRHEDHVGHKVEWDNDIVLPVPGRAGALIEVHCAVLTKLHQGTHSKDAFTNNLHELFYHIRCNDGTEMHIRLLSAIGHPGQFEKNCGGTVVVGAANPVNSPDGGGQRVMPHASCLRDRILRPLGHGSDFFALHESWQTSNAIQLPNGRTLAFFNPYFQVFRPSRYFDSTQVDNLGRALALCYAVGPNGERAQGGDCAASTDSGRAVGVLWNDTRSQFNGAWRQVDINENDLRNAGGSRIWYTDPFGRNATTTPFPGAVRQVLAVLDNDWGVRLNGPTIGGDRPYTATGLHAPN